MPVLRFRTIASLLTCAMLVACASSTVGTPPAPTPHVTLTKTQQALEVDAGLTATNGIRFASLLAAVVGQLIPGARRAPQAAPVCKNGVEQVINVSPEGVDATINVFYDPACRHPLVKSHLTATLKSSSSAADLKGTFAAYDAHGKATGYGSIAGTSHFTASSSNTVVTGKISKTPAGTPFLSFGLDCTLSSTKPNSCGFGALNALVPGSNAIGVTASLDKFVGSGASDGTVSLNGFVGPSAKLKLAKGPGNSWKITGGTHVVTENGTFSEHVYAQRFLVLLDLQLVDRLGDADVVGRLGSLGTLGTVTQHSNGLRAATYSTLPDGTGTIVYSDGTTGTILFFVVI